MSETRLSWSPDMTTMHTDGFTKKIVVGESDSKVLCFIKETSFNSSDQSFIVEPTPALLVSSNIGVEISNANGMSTQKPARILRASQSKGHLLASDGRYDRVRKEINRIDDPYIPLVGLDTEENVVRIGPEIRFDPTKTSDQIARVLGIKKGSIDTADTLS